SAEAAVSDAPIPGDASRFCADEAPLARAVWYLHAKGVSPQHSRNPNVTDWRRLLEHFVIDRWEECVTSPPDHDACGVNWHTDPAPHFSGNCWWAPPRYLPTLTARIGPIHFDPEA